jgi:hypothetical protein
VCRKHGETVTLPNNVVQMDVGIKPRMEGCFLNMVPFGRRNGAVMRGMTKFSQSGGVCKKHGASKTKLSSSSAAAVLMTMERQQLLPLPITAKTSFPV